MIADVVNVDRFRFAILDSGDDVADAGFAFGGFPEVAGVREDGFKELQRHDFLTLVFDLVNAGHADVLEDFQMFQVVLRKRHPELRAFEGRDVFDERLELLVIHPVNFVGADLLRTGERLMFRHRSGLDKFAVFPMAALGGDFADVDFRIEVRGERAAVIATVDIDDVERVDFIEMMFQRPSGENIGHSRIEAGTEQGGEAGFFKFFLIRPLPGVFEFRNVERLVVCGVKVVDTGLQTSIHQVEILVGKGDVDQKDRTGLFDERGGFIGVIGIDLRGGNGFAGALLDGCGDRIAFRNRAGRESDFAKSLGKHRAFVSDHTSDSAGSDDEDIFHFNKG